MCRLCMHSSSLQLNTVHLESGSQPLPTFSGVPANAQTALLCQVLLQGSHTLCQSLYSFYLLLKTVNRGGIDFVFLWFHSFGRLNLEIHWSHWMNHLIFITWKFRKYLCRQAEDKNHKTWEVILSVPLFYRWRSQNPERSTSSPWDQAFACF